MTDTTCRVLMGNVAPAQHVRTGSDPDDTKRVSRPDAGPTVTYVSMRPDYADEDAAALAMCTDNDPVLSMIGRRLPQEHVKYVTALRDVEDFWQLGHSDRAPEWVASPDDPEFAKALAEHYSSPRQKCAVGWPSGFRTLNARVLFTAVPHDMLPDVVPAAAVKDVEDDDMRQMLTRVMRGEAPRPPIGGGCLDVLDPLVHEWLSQEFRPGFADAWREHALMTNLGRDNGMRSLYDETRTSILGPFSVMSLSANATAEAAATTTLPGRITTAGGGLAPGTATFAHTAATSTFTKSRTATVNGSDTGLPVTIAKVGLEDASGNCGHEKLLSATAALSAVGDNIAATFTGTWTPS